MQVFVLGILLAIPAFFAAGEVAIIRLRPSRVERLLEEGTEGAQAIHRLQRRMRRALMVAQLGVTVSLVSLGWFGYEFTNELTTSETSKTFWKIFVFLGIVILATLLSGLLPKALVLNRQEAAALKLAPLLEIAMRTMAPVLYVLEKIASLLLKLVGLNTRWDSLVSALSAGELESLIESGSVTGLLPDEKNILEGVFALRDTQVREVMIPRSGMVTLPREVCFAELMREVHISRHARFFVTGDSLDDVLGVLDLRRLAEPISNGEMQADTPLAPYIKPAPKVLETATLAELLPLIKSGNPLLLVIDEHGGTEGLITATDLTGEIVGDEIQTEINEPYLLQIDGNPLAWLADGNFEIIELNRQLNLDLPESDNHHTIAGFLLEKLQKVPIVGQKLLYKKTKFDIISMQGPRINRVKIILTKDSPEEDSQELRSSNS
ncbi:hemolysin family protein [Prochlorococcus sp. MIT 1223]|uniref:hemolysin family protein n=1 Tax=Prochlorococcus sp. MIT 1223 TaxID=3096217 RepID=UPI002A765927|nr:hemolysin family protein [Prochlorococcus sp. MIT 1223]